MIEPSEKELMKSVAPVVAAILTNAYFTALALPKYKDSPPEDVEGDIIEAYHGFLDEWSTNPRAIFGRKYDKDLKRD